MNKTILLTGALLGLLAVLAGAFGAHGLKELIDVQALQSFETGVKYQMYHALLLLFLGNTAYVKMRYKKIVFFLILSGVVLFSGSIYGLATNSLSGFDFKRAALLTPLGGTLLIAGWAVLAWSIIKLKNMIK